MVLLVCIIIIEKFQVHLLHEERRRIATVHKQSSQNWRKKLWRFVEIPLKTILSQAEKECLQFTLEQLKI